MSHKLYINDLIEKRKNILKLVKEFRYKELALVGCVSRWFTYFFFKSFNKEIRGSKLCEPDSRNF